MQPFEGCLPVVPDEFIEGVLDENERFVVFAEAFLFYVIYDVQGCELYGFIPVHQLVACVLEQEGLLDFLVFDLRLVATREVARR